MTLKKHFIMQLSATDTACLIRLLDRAATLIDRTATKPREADVARRMKQFSKKLKKKSEQ